MRDSCSGPCPSDLPSICDALEHAHEKNVIHRDLKPLNVCLLKQPDGTELVKIVDFGLAKILGADGSEGRKLTRPGQICGSPLYMSPEQIQGKQLDRRSDVYSLGCLMYETLSGVPPFLADTTFETMNLHVVESVRKFNDRLEIPPQLEAVIFRALEKDKDKRYQTALELKNDLAEFGNKGAAQPRMKLQRSQIIAAAIGVCLLIAFVICVLGQCKIIALKSVVSLIFSSPRHLLRPVSERLILSFKSCRFMASESYAVRCCLFCLWRGH